MTYPKSVEREHISDPDGVPAPSRADGRVMPATPKHIPELDGLRALAAMGVVLAHYIDVTRNPRWYIAFQGFFGVYLFFALSGFLITRILLAAKESPGYFRNFYARRALRIFPLYYGVLALNFFVLLPLMPTPAVRAEAAYQGWLWTYTSNILMSIQGRLRFTADWLQLTHFWTLAVEEQFYLVWPAVVLLLRRRQLLILCLVLAVSSTFCRYGLYRAGANGLAIRWATPCVLDGLALGGAIACLEAAGLLRQVAKWTKPACWVLAYVLFQFWLRYPRSPDNPEMHLLIIYHAVMTAFMAGIVLLTVTGSFRWLGHRVLRDIGQKSYGIYVFHIPLIGLLPLVGFHLPRLRHFFHSQTLGDLAYFVSMAAITYVVSFLSYHLYEKHFLKLKRFFTSRSEKRRLGAARETETPGKETAENETPFAGFPSRAPFRLDPAE